MSDQTVVTFGSFALDCADPEGVAQFYADLLGGSVTAEPEGDWFTVRWDGPDLATQLAPNHESPDWPRGQQQVHLDLKVVDIAAAHRRVLELGGPRLTRSRRPSPRPSAGSGSTPTRRATRSASADPRPTPGAERSETGRGRGSGIGARPG